MPIVDYKPKPRKKRKKETFATETRRVIKSLVITLSLMIIVLTMAFISVTNQIAQKGYSLQQAKLKNEDLKNYNEIINVKITDTTSFSNINESYKLNIMEKPEDKKYVTEEDNLVY